MKRESYLSQPQPFEVYPVFSGTDIIMRKNIELVEKEEVQDGNKSKYNVWECDEVQCRCEGNITKDEIEKNFEHWWEIADKKTEVESIDKESGSKKEPTVADRLDALESGLAELAEVMCNG